MPLEAEHLAQEKIKFLRKFRLSKPLEPGWKDRALRDATTASSRRSGLYRTGLTQTQRNGVRQGWWERLEHLSAEYTRMESVTQEHFEKDVVNLRESMNTEFPEFWADAAVGRYEPGFRIAHAQKSLSLILKHYWCNNAISEPPCCPVDRRVLQIAGATDPSWTHINSMEAYRSRLDDLLNAAARSPFAPIRLAEWELLVFN